MSPGAIWPASIAAEAADWLAHPERLAGMRNDLRSLRGRPGAVAALAAMVQELLPLSSRPKTSRLETTLLPITPQVAVADQELS